VWIGRTAARAGIGLLLGTVTAAVTLCLLVVAGVVLAPALAWPARRTAALRLGASAALRLAGLEQRRLARWFGDEAAAAYGDYGPDRALAYLGLRWPVGLLGGAVLLLTGYGAATMAVFGWMWATGNEPDGIPFGWLVAAYFVGSGLVLGFLALQGLIGVVRLERRLARRFIGPTTADALRRRIEELSASRAEVVAAIDAERRRIERDLHDGVQQRLVALGMLLGQARRNTAAGRPDRSAALVEQAHDESRQILDDLREVAWRVYPAALDNLGLRDALARVAERSSVPAELRYELTGQPPGAVASTAYFVVSEAVTNAIKHAAAGRVVIHVDQEPGFVKVSVTDDGRGGADPAGGGLTGLARRVAAIDGRLTVASPAGGPTVVTAELPCG
jgi:signal transduction histidine kinase